MKQEVLTQSIEIEKGNKKKKPIPKCFICPLNKQLMKNPVMLSSGNTFEKTAIENHIR